MRSSRLQSTSILHHGFDTVGFFRSCKTFVGGFFTSQYGYSHKLFGKSGVNFQHLFRLKNRFFTTCVGGVSFLPQKFSSSEEKAGTHFPTHHICPLVYQQRQVSVGLYPVFVGTPNNSFRRRANDEFFFQFGFGIHHQFARFIRIIFEAIVRNHSTFFGESLSIFFFGFKKAFRHKKGEIGVLMPCFLKHIV